MHPDKPGPIGRRATAVRRAIRFTTRRIAGKRIRILVEIRWRLGDEIMAIPIYESIKRVWPDCELSVACTHPDLLVGNPYVDRVFTHDVYAGADYDRLINLRDASRTVPRHEHYARIAGLPVPDHSPAVYWTGDEPLFDMRGQWVAVSTGASWATKRWPLSAWQALCLSLQAHGYNLVQLGHDDERIGLKHDFVGQTSIREAGVILDRCALFIGSDSGLLHLAAAVGTRTIGLFGPTDPDVLFGEYNPITAIRNGRPCAMCWNGPLTMREPGVCPQQIDGCMEAISEETVIAAALAELKRPAAADRCA